MKSNSKGILSLDLLKIGYITGKDKRALLPPLSANAVTGELIAVIGRNGIGKSTLLRTLTGLQQPLDGEIYFEGKNIRDYTRMELAQKIGYISTEIIKITNMRVYDLVALGRFPYTNWLGKIGKKDDEIIMDALKKTSLESFSGKYISELSDGERQKSMIARILAQDTSIMIMDEPTAFLDVAGKYEILHLMQLLSGKSDKTIIFSTHDLQMAINQSDKIWLILDNKLIEGAPEDLMIGGAFDNLFDSSTVVFNSEDGTFSSRRDTKGSIYIEGNSNKRYWTEKAINRAGFIVSKEKTIPYVIMPYGNQNYWQLSGKYSTQDCLSIYELISCLLTEMKRPI